MSEPRVGSLVDRAGGVCCATRARSSARPEPGRRWLRDPRTVRCPTGPYAARPTLVGERLRRGVDGPSPAGRRTVAESRPTTVARRGPTDRHRTVDDRPDRPGEEQPRAVRPRERRPTRRRRLHGRRRDPRGAQGLPLRRVHPAVLVHRQGHRRPGRPDLDPVRRRSSRSTSGSFAQQLGAESSIGAAMVLAIVRESAPVATALLIAGAGGSAMTADLGSRRIRNELDAMEVMGVDPIHRLVLPRLAAASLVAVLLNGLVSVAGIAGGWVMAVPVQGGTSGAYFASFTELAHLPDLWSAMIKATHLRLPRRRHLVLVRLLGRRRAEVGRRRGQPRGRPDLHHPVLHQLHRDRAVLQPRPAEVLTVAARTRSPRPSTPTTRALRTVVAAAAAVRGARGPDAVLGRGDRGDALQPQVVAVGHPARRSPTSSSAPAASSSAAGCCSSSRRWRSSPAPRSASRASPALDQIGAQAYVGLISSFANVREITPLIAGIALAAKVGAGYTAELGAMRISEEIDAAEVIGVRPIPYLVSTRLWAALIPTIPLYLLALFSAFFATRLIVTGFYTVSPGAYDTRLDLFLPPIDIFYSVAKAIVFVVVVVLIHTYYGFYAKGGPAGVGVAVGRAIRASHHRGRHPQHGAVVGLLGSRRRDHQDRGVSERGDRSIRSSSDASSGPRPPCWCSRVATSCSTARYAPPAGSYQVTAELGRAGSGVRQGTDVKVRGVAHRAGRRDPLRGRGRARPPDARPRTAPARPPTTSTLVVTPKTLLGEKQIDLSFPDGRLGERPVPRGRRPARGLARPDRADRGHRRARAVPRAPSTRRTSRPSSTCSATSAARARSSRENIELGQQLAAFGDRTAPDDAGPDPRLHRRQPTRSRGRRRT